jgi:enamine deaminase RidA (YjgF/YER057c/UK114 family)
MMRKKGLGPVIHNGAQMTWGKGAKAGNFVFLSGVEARDEKTDVPVSGIRAQTELALDRIKKRLEEAGTTIDNVVKFVWYLSDRSMEQEFLNVRDEWMRKNAPLLLKERSYAGTLLIVGLALYEMLIEIDCIAYVEE